MGTRLALLILGLSLPAAAYGQGLHGVTIAKGCLAPLCEGETTNCDIQLGYNDDFGDTIRVLSAWDVQDFGGDNVRVPATGDLPIVNVGGNTTCTIGGFLPCLIGPGGSTLSGLPGDPQPGFVRFRQNAYVVQPDDPDVLRDRATVEWEDLCDDPDTSGCGAGVINPAPAPASTRVTDCDDDDPCTIDICGAGQCTYLPVECDDGDVCTEDACDPATGECVYTPVVFCDSDEDGEPDSTDNCPYVPNNSGDDIQNDTDANGIGDACQCGDVNGDGYTNVSDALAIARGQVLSDDPHYGKCDCDGDTHCNVSDALMIARGQQGSAHEDQLCPAYQGL